MTHTDKAAANPPRALITGASAGIGAALARQFAAAGHDLVLVARSKPKLRALAKELKADHGVKVTVLPTDLSQADARRGLFNEVEEGGFAINVLVNNAGILEMGAFADIETGRHLDLIELNVAGLTQLTHLFLGPMIARGEGKVLNVASIAAFQPIPSLATYAATKAYVLSLTEALSEELKETGITLTALCPGITATDMVAQAQASNDLAARLPGLVISDVDDVAAQGFTACMKGEVIRVPGVLNQAATLAARSAPKWLVRAVGGLMGRAAL